MRKYIGMFVLAALAISSCMAAPGDKGSTYLSLSRSVSVKGDFDRQKQTVAGFGTYLSDNLSVGVEANFVPCDTLRVNQVNAVVNYDLKAVDATGETVPYIGVSAGFSDIRNHKLDDFRSDGQYGVQAGVRHTVNDRVALFAEYAYKRSIENVDHQDAILIGLRLFN